MILRAFLVVVLSTASLAWAQAPTPEYQACGNSRGDVDPAEQEKACSAIIKLGDSKDDLAATYSNRGQSFMRRREYDKAVEDYGQAIALNPRLAAAYRSRGVAYFVSGRFDKALADYDAAIRIDPHEPGSYADRCSVRVVTGKPQEAKVDCDKAIDLDPRNGSGHAWRALVYLQLGDLNAADRDINSISRDYPTNASLHYLRAMVLEAKGQKIEAEAQFQMTRELDAAEFATLERLYGRFRKR